MNFRRVGAMVLVLLTACSSAPRAVVSSRDGGEPIVRIPRAGNVEQVELDDEEFQEAVVELARTVRASRHPLEAARRLFELSERSGSYVYVVKSRQLIAHPDDSLTTQVSRADEELKRAYLLWCERTHRAGDCLRLLAQTPVLDHDGKYALAMSIAMGSVMEEAKEALGEMADPMAVVATILGAMTMYMVLLTVPEPVSKGIAAVLTATLIVYLGVDTVWRLVGGWLELMEEVDHATTFEQLRVAGARYGEVMGENVARIFVMLVTAVLGHTSAVLGSQLPRLPGAGQATVMSEAQTGLGLAEVVGVRMVTLTAEGAALTLAPGAVAMADQSMGSLPKRSARHHIATNKNTESDVRGGPWTPRFQKLFDRAKMSLDDETNIVEVAGHQGPHPEQYHQAIFDRLEDATATCRGSEQCARALRAALKELAEEIAAPGTFLNKLVTQSVAQ